MIKIYEGIAMKPIVLRSVLLVLIGILLLANKVLCQDQAKKYIPDWESLKQHEDPEWFRDAKFGIYTHWGPYSVPAFGHEWYPRKMYVDKNFRRGNYYQFHLKKYGDPAEFGYKDFVPMFTAENFNAEEWADIFHKAGAKFAGPVAEHHDGFAMWNSDLTEWDAFDKGPKRDIVGELGKVIREKGMKYITSFHHARKWWYYEESYTPNKCHDTEDPEYAGIYKIYPPVHKKMPRLMKNICKNGWQKLKRLLINIDRICFGLIAGFPEKNFGAVQLVILLNIKRSSLPIIIIKQKNGAEQSE